jgi:hypothetical protein
VKVDVTDEDHGYADVTDADATKLTSVSRGSAQILWKESGTGLKWATVRLGVPPAPFRYWIAQAAANFAWVEEDNPSANHQGEFRLDNTSGEENLVVIHSDTILGSKRPISDLILDIPHVSSSWTAGMTNGSPGPEDPPPAAAVWERLWTVEPILEDFDPSTVDWDDVAALSTGAAATCSLIHQTATLDVQSYEEPPISGVEAAVDLVSEVPGWLCIKRQDLAAWSGYDAIYGFKVQIGTSGAPSTAVWVGSAGAAVCYALPS